MAPVTAAHHIFPIHFLYVSHHFSGISALTHSVKLKFRRPKKYPLHSCHLHFNYSHDYSYISHFAHRKSFGVYPFHFFPSKEIFWLNCSIKPADSVAQDIKTQKDNDQQSEEGNSKESQSIENIALAIEEMLPTEGFIVALACIVGLLTGIAVVLFNLAVGMAAMLAGVCQVPLTSVLLLFELTRDYLIIIPLMAAVGFSSWISSSFTREKTKKLNVKKPVSFKFHKEEKEEFQNKNLLNVSQKSMRIQSNLVDMVQSYPISKEKLLSTSNLCKLESSLCVANQDFKVEQLEELIPVMAAMRTHYVTVFQRTSLQEAILLILAQKEWCALIVDGNGYLKGILTLGDIQKYVEMARANDKPVEMGAVSVSEVCSWDGGGKGRELLTVFPHTTLKVARQLMSIRGLRQLPVVTEAAPEKNEMGALVGLLDRESINLACRAEITKRLLGLSSLIEDSETK